MTVALGIAVAGALGAPARWLLDGLVQRRLARLRPGTLFPAGTLVVNLIGCALLGLLTGLVLHHGLPATARLLLGTGFCGAFTTFSTFTFESVRLVEEGRWGAAAGYLFVSVAGGLAAAATALAVAGLG